MSHVYYVLATREDAGRVKAGLLDEQDYFMMLAYAEEHLAREVFFKDWRGDLLVWTDDGRPEHLGDDDCDGTVDCEYAIRPDDAWFRRGVRQHREVVAMRAALKEVEGGVAIYRGWKEREVEARTAEWAEVADLLVREATAEKEQKG
jgi:hypothetical protein